MENQLTLIKSHPLVNKTFSIQERGRELKGERKYTFVAKLEIINTKKVLSASLLEEKDFFLSR